MSNLLDMDFSKLEERMVALEGTVIPARINIDLHRERAAKEYGCDVSEVTPTMRRSGKFLNYLDLYGGSRNV